MVQILLYPIAGVHRQVNFVTNRRTASTFSPLMSTPMCLLFIHGGRGESNENSKAGENKEESQNDGGGRKRWVIRSGDHLIASFPCPAFLLCAF